MLLSLYLHLHKPNMKGILVICIAVLALAQVLVQPSLAISCMALAPSMVQCAPFVMGATPQPTTGCCTEIRRLNAMLQTAADRKQICVCVKQYAPQYPNIPDSVISALPQKCGLPPVPFPLTRNIDCNRIS